MKQVWNKLKDMINQKAVEFIEDPMSALEKRQALQQQQMKLETGSDIQDVLVWFNLKVRQWFPEEKRLVVDKLFVELSEQYPKDY